jgi:hypothetical protein
MHACSSDMNVKRPYTWMDGWMNDYLQLHLMKVVYQKSQVPCTLHVYTIIIIFRNLCVLSQIVFF